MQHALLAYNVRAILRSGCSSLFAAPPSLLSTQAFFGHLMMSIQRNTEPGPAAVLRVPRTTTWQATSSRVEVAVLERHDVRVVPVFVPQVKSQKARYHEIPCDEIEPREHGCLEHTDIGTEQYD
jgi:hypothetical protein